MTGANVYELVFAKIEKHRQALLNRGMEYIPKHEKIYLGVEVKKILEDWNNARIAGKRIEYKTFSGIPIIDKPTIDCISVPDFLIAPDQLSTYELTKP